MKLPHHISPNPNFLIKSKFTKSFLRSLLKINGENTNTPNYPGYEIIKRCDRVKIAADKSLASAVGSRRAWSRALLSKIRNRARRPKRWLLRRRRIRRIGCRKSELKREEEEGGGDFDEAKKLRKLVPGGEAMDLCSLLEEAAHYVMCLNTQVQVMACIADFCSST